MLKKLNKSMTLVATSMVIIGGNSVLVQALPTDINEHKLESKSSLENKENLTELTNIKNTENISVKNKSNAEKVKKEPIKDGVYSIGFTIYKLENNEKSMMNNFLDKNAKLEVKNGKATLTVLFNIFADQIYDFRIESNGKTLESVATDYGIFNEQTKKHEYKKFQVDISDIDSAHKGYVLVGAMGGLTSDIGNLSKYREANFVFDRSSLKKWNGFEVDKKASANYDDELNKKLLKSNLDKNKDGIVSDEELKLAKGKIKLESVNVNDFEKIKLLGENVNELIIFGENIKEIPKDTFKNLKNLKKLDLRVYLSKLPEGIFDNLENLEELTLMRNNISNLPKGIFDKLIKLKSLNLEENPLEKLNSNIFNNLNKLEYLSLKSIKLKEIPNQIYKLSNLKTLNLENNELTEVSKEIGDLKTLNALYLGLNYLEELPKEIYNLKNLETFAIDNNLLSQIPKNLFELLPNSKNVFYQYNKIKLEDMPENPSDKFIIAYPQNIMNLNLTAKNGIISWKQDFSSLDMLCWRKFSARKNVPKNVEEYKTCLNGKDPLEIVKNNFWRPIIETKIQKKNKNGDYITIKEIINDNEPNHSDTYTDSTMKNEDEYRIVKKVSIEEFGSVKFVFKDIVCTKAKMNNEKPIINDNNETTEKTDNKELVKPNEENISEFLEKPINNNKDIISNTKLDDKELVNTNKENTNELVEKPVINDIKDNIATEKTDNNKLVNSNIVKDLSKNNSIQKQEIKEDIEKTNINNFLVSNISKNDIKKSKQNNYKENITNSLNENIKRFLPKTGSLIDSKLLLLISNLLATLGLLLKRKK